MRVVPALALVASTLLAVSLMSSCSSPGPVQKGINVLWYNNPADTDAQVAAKANDTMRYIKHLGANAVAINFPFYMTGPTANRVSVGPATPSPRQLLLAIRAAKHYNLAVTLRPLLDESSFGTNAWRGTLEPTYRAAWFASYGLFLESYLTMAEKAGVESFCIGVELTSLESDGRWVKLVAQARQLYHGRIVYDNNWYGLQVSAAGIAADAQGLDAYFPVQLGDTASVAEIVNGWNDWLDHLPASVNVNSMTLSEVGIAAQSGAYTMPYSLGNPKVPINPSIQQRWFTAACQVMEQRGMPGIFFWSVNFGDVPGTFDWEHAAPNSIVGRGSVAVQACFRDLYPTWAGTADRHHRGDQLGHVPVRCICLSIISFGLRVSFRYASK